MLCVCVCCRGSRPPLCTSHVDLVVLVATDLSAGLTPSERMGSIDHCTVFRLSSAHLTLPPSLSAIVSPCQFSAERAIQQRRQRAFEVESAQRRAADFYQQGTVTTLQVRDRPASVTRVSSLLHALTLTLTSCVSLLWAKFHPPLCSRWKFSPALPQFSRPSCFGVERISVFIYPHPPRFPCENTGRQVGLG
jgi:hypothetical protein